MSNPTLNDRSLGWLRFLWDKATTPDDWSDQGEPHVWWDRYSQPPMCAFPRFDLAETGYVLPVMCEATPAWREVYVRIADELIRRYVSFWGAVDWCTLIGPDPYVDRYPPEWLAVVPESMRGRYAMPGWTANGVEPWGLQPDPVGADGNLFYRGWLNLLLGIRRYISGEAREHEPFEVTGYRNRQFTWTHARMARYLSAQFAARPQGPHCENTKIWPFCCSAATLGLQLYDGLVGEDTHAPVPDWIDYVRRHYTAETADGELDWFALYYDPMIAEAMILPGPVSAYSALTVLHYLQPQDRAWTERLYGQAVRRLGWSDPTIPVTQLADDPQMLSTAYWMAREVGDDVTEARLREVVETTMSPRFFGAENDRFGFFYGHDEPWPRGQLSATLMLTECGGPGACARVFTAPNTAMHTEPTLTGVDYPRLAIRGARYDPARAVLDIDTAAGSPSSRGQVTTVTVEQLHDPAAVTVTVDGHRCDRWRVTAPDALSIDIDIDTHHVEVATTTHRSRP
ncbi:hypothetical protein EV383_2660 [Pseudonocardia sediminis]|uniref:Linalool dehydratase/isomerase domain-containing protein n=1 Tax=Pseudonocardia sediminis TaxID=1397368 RepID=A0A4V2FQR6_PSEST|nr:hypothetical protein [Pseudonocardia sediminis]RZT85780.1 hypothetical protein EV383_2660 [Pseudonocardia sediminis]